MTFHRKPPERRTFSQDRFEILIKRQRNGVASFSELTELDEIVNRDPEIRERVIRENILMEGSDEQNLPADTGGKDNICPPARRLNLRDKVKIFISRIFYAGTFAIKAGTHALCA